MRQILSTLGLIILVSPVSGQLAVKGEGVKVVKVDKVVTIKVDVTVVQEFPFSISVPTENGEGLYFWTIPAGIVAEDKGDTLIVKDAPKGSITISVKAVTAKLDKDGKFIGFAHKIHTVAFHIGEITESVVKINNPPAPPEPKTNTPGLVQHLQTTYDNDKANQNQKAVLASLYRRSATILVPDKRYVSPGDINNAMKFTLSSKEMQLSLSQQGISFDPNRTLLSTRAALKSYQDTALATMGIAAGPLSDESRSKLAVLLTDIANALDQVK